MSLAWSWEIDGWIIAVATLCALAAALIGNFLVLRRMSMLGDAISHAVLPGLAAAFFISDSRSSWPMFVGAVLVGILTAFFTEWIRRVGRVDEGASMGVVFTSLFALGLILIVQAADHVDLDPGCVLYGAIELTPLDRIDFFGMSIPRAAAMLMTVALINLLFVVVMYKELKIASFDPALATTLGFNSSLIHYLLMILVAVTAVASFETVGNVLVVAMFVVPPAASYMLTDRLQIMIPLSLFLAVLAAVGGHLGAVAIPTWFGFQSTTTAGSMAVVAGGLLLIAALFSPRHGILVKWMRRKLLSLRILADDVIALLFRLDEHEGQTPATRTTLLDLLLCGRTSLRLVLAWLLRRGDLIQQADGIALTDRGRARGQNLVRSHRLWEQYLQDYAGVAPDRVHPQAEKLEHFTDSELRQRLDSETLAPSVDPHGRPIPEEQSEQRHR